MGKRPKKPCNRIGCHNLVEYPRVYCEAHQEYEDRLKASRYREYDKQRDKKFVDFYNDEQWKKRTRKHILTRDNYKCQDCGYINATGRGLEVHHIIEVKEDWDKRYDEDNLITLCKSCHRKRHTKSSPPLFSR